MSRKIGIIGGLGWPATIAYYEAICRAAATAGGIGTPEMTIESLDMSKTLAARGTLGNAQSWAAFDSFFTDALARLDAASCDFAAIASVTPHTRLATISKASPLPIVSIVDAVIANLGASTKTKAAILGTSVTMKGSLFDQGLKDLGIEVLRPEQADITAFTDLLNTYFYSGQAEEGLAELVVYVRSVFGASEDLLCILACTDLAPAFPDKIGQITFDAEGLTFFDATTAHIDAILTAASSAPDEARVGGG